MNSPIRVLTVDDHPLMRDGIAFIMQKAPDMELVAEATNGVEAVAAYRKHRPDVTLMDLQMPVMNGIEAIQAIREEFPKARIVVLTTYSGDVHATRALQAGAMGFILKSMLGTELIDTIRAAHQGRKRISDEIAHGMAEHLGSESLSTRELQVLQAVASGCSNKIVADRLSISEDTVKGHMKNVLAKLQANDRTHAVLIALKRGILEA
ncbi:response regulator transcription factor [Terriglobus albidus]|uniref:Response regulator transcription factor n=1 Tax=Terriglobus albidus TaxID=1592106 RepID=A0A5B9EF85_9BACT|nr:response regulator transcription factor [Terriglobus albidus]QEE30314.1 response regulator transcription factor [Terriglobus albidus]